MPSVRHCKVEQNNHPSTSQVTSSSKRRRVSRATIKDSQQAVLLQVNSINDFYPSIDELSLKLREKKQSLQPLIVYASQSNTFITYYDDIKYQFQSLLAAIDTCFKIFFVLNVKYPEAAKNVWIFIQKFFYEIETHERISPDVLVLLSELNNKQC